MKAARQAWFAGQPELDLTRLVFLDETWTSTNMACLRARSPRGARLRSGVLHGRWKTTTLVAGLRLSGIAAPFVIDRPINRDAFQAYVDQVLVPELIPAISSSWTTSAAQGSGRAGGDRGGGRVATVSPALLARLQPNRNGVLEAQALLRKAAERTVKRLWSAIGRLVDTVTPDECANVFAAAGYKKDTNLIKPKTL